MSSPPQNCGSNNGWAGLDLSWYLWRLSVNGGVLYRQRYLEQFSGREDANDFMVRRNITPIPNFVRAALMEIRNAIFQRLCDVLRIGGSTSYQEAVNGVVGGVDGRGSTMNAFLGQKILTELLMMGKVGVYVDSPSLPANARLSDVQGVRPYLYHYQVEDVLNFTTTKPEVHSEYKAVLLRDTGVDFDGVQGLPCRTVQRYRSLWLNDKGTVSLQMYDENSNPIDAAGNKLDTETPTELQLTRIPFAMLDIGDSLIKDVCWHQIALLNLGSSDVNYALRANFPFYTQQTDKRGFGSHLKSGTNADGSAVQGGQGAKDDDIRVGVTQGIRYDMKAERPGFINPSSEPLKASMELQTSLKADIRALVNLAVESLAVKGGPTDQGLEGGLSFIGLVLESAERKIASYWADYEDTVPSRRKIATIKYPDRYSLKTDENRIDESTKLASLMTKVPGATVKREIAKLVVQSLLGGKVNVETLNTINKEIDASASTTSDPDTIIAAVTSGLVGAQTASMALGFGPEEYKQAAIDHAARIARIAQAQGVGNNASDPGARGVPDLSANANAGKEERQLANDTTLADSPEPPVRGPDAGITNEPKQP